MQQAVLSHSMFLTSIESLEAYTEEHSVTPCTFSLLSLQPFFRSVTFCTACNNTPTRNCATFNQKNDTLCIQPTLALTHEQTDKSLHTVIADGSDARLLYYVVVADVCVNVQCITSSDIMHVVHTHLSAFALLCSLTLTHLLHRWFRPRSGK